jgi:hypothetical protein
MSTAIYWLGFAAVAALLLIVVPLVGAWEARRDRERGYLEQFERYERTEKARRRIRLGL